MQEHHVIVETQKEANARERGEMTGIILLILLGMGILWLFWEITKEVYLSLSAVNKFFIIPLVILIIVYILFKKRIFGDSKQNLSELIKQQFPYFLAYTFGGYLYFYQLIDGEFHIPYSWFLSGEGLVFTYVLYLAILLTILANLVRLITKKKIMSYKSMLIGIPIYMWVSYALFIIQKIIYPVGFKNLGFVILFGFVITFFSRIVWKFVNLLMRRI